MSSPEESSQFDPQSLQTDIAIRFAIALENCRTVCEYLVTLRQDFEKNQELVERIDKGDIFAFFSYMHEFEKMDNKFAALAATVRALEAADK